VTVPASCQFYPALLVLNLTLFFALLLGRYLYLWKRPDSFAWTLRHALLFFVFYVSLKDRRGCLLSFCSHHFFLKISPRQTRVQEPDSFHVFFFNQFFCPPLRFRRKFRFSWVILVSNFPNRCSMFFFYSYSFFPPSPLCMVTCQILPFSFPPPWPAKLLICHFYLLHRIYRLSAAIFHTRCRFCSFFFPLYTCSFFHSTPGQLSPSISPFEAFPLARFLSLGIRKFLGPPPPVDTPFRMISVAE